MRTFVNGLGCRDYGSLRVLNEFLEHCGAPGMTTLELNSRCAPHAGDKPGVLQLRIPAPGSENLRGALRLALDGLVWLTRGLGAERVVNLSNYGLPCGPASLLLLHNALTLAGDDRSASGRLKRLLTVESATRSTLCAVQTQHMADLLRRACEEDGRRSAQVLVFTPRPEVRSEPPLHCTSGRRLEFFYPCSRYAHKQVDFARDLFTTADCLGDTAALTLTVDGSNSARVTCTGVLPEATVQARLAAADALFFASTAESLGLPLVDALLLGKPAVLPDLPYAREIYGDAANYYTPLSTGSALEAIRALGSDTAQWQRRVLNRRESFLLKALPPGEYYRSLLNSLGQASQHIVL